LSIFSFVSLLQSIIIIIITTFRVTTVSTTTATTGMIRGRLHDDECVSDKQYRTLKMNDTGKTSFGSNSLVFHPSFVIFPFFFLLIGLFVVDGTDTENKEKTACVVDCRCCSPSR
jgi:phosphate/sulfate permease